MRRTTSESTLELVERQLNCLFPLHCCSRINLDVARVAFDKTVRCIRSVKDWGANGFDCLVSWQYATYLYWLGRELYVCSHDIDNATRVFLLNKALNSIELYFEVELPQVFFLSHTTGAVFAQADYGEWGVFHQGCTIGRNNNDRPVLEPGVVLYPNSSVIGRCLVRENTVIAPGVQLVNKDTPGDCYVFSGGYGEVVFKSIDEYFIDRYFNRASDLSSG